MLSTRIDDNTKLALTNAYDSMDISTSQALKIFAKAVINYGGIPFELKAKTPNPLTAAAIDKLESGKVNTAKNIEELFSDLEIVNLKDAET